ncbi:MAG: hypothetical protein ACRELV_16200 [Longimicrobiales bacterium]
MSGDDRARREDGEREQEGEQEGRRAPEPDASWTPERERAWREALASGDAARRALLRRASFMTWGFLGLAVLVAVGGSAFLAWIFMAVDLPFLETWAVLVVLTLGLPALGQLVLRVRERRARRRRDGG